MNLVLIYNAEELAEISASSFLYEILGDLIADVLDFTASWRENFHFFAFEILANSISAVFLCGVKPFIGSFDNAFDGVACDSGCETNAYGHFDDFARRDGYVYRLDIFP